MERGRTSHPLSHSLTHVPTHLTNSFTIIARTAMTLFQCMDIGEASFLSADLSQSCGDPSHKAMMWGVGLPLLLVVVLVPLLTVFAIRRAREDIYAPRDPVTGAIVHPGQKEALTAFAYGKK